MTPPPRRPAATGAAQHVHIIDGRQGRPDEDCVVGCRRFITRGRQSRGTSASTAAATRRATRSAFHTARTYASVKSHAPDSDIVSPATAKSGAPSQIDVSVSVCVLSQ